jgi:hypothetical protein
MDSEVREGDGTVQFLKSSRFYWTLAVVSVLVMIGVISGTSSGTQRENLETTFSPSTNEMEETQLFEVFSSISDLRNQANTPNIFRHGNMEFYQGGRTHEGGGSA